MRKHILINTKRGRFAIFNIPSATNRKVINSMVKDICSITLLKNKTFPYKVYSRENLKNEIRENRDINILEFVK